MCICDCVVRLEGTDPAYREGRLEVFYSGAWGTVCDHSFSNISAQVACNILGFGYVPLIMYLIISRCSSTDFKTAAINGSFLNLTKRDRTFAMAIAVITGLGVP